ncbi:MAG: plectin [Streptosporangiaceae bacterium]
MVFGRRVSADVAEQFAADQELAATYSDRLAVVEAKERQLRHAQAERRTAGEQRALAGELDAELLAAISAAEAAERVVMGTGSYGTERPAEIARRKARAKASVRPYTGEVVRLRTAREAHKLSYRSFARV